MPEKINRRTFLKTAGVQTAGSPGASETTSGRSKISRREFLQLSALATASAALASCVPGPDEGGGAPVSEVSPVPELPAPTAQSTAVEEVEEVKITPSPSPTPERPDLTGGEYPAEIKARIEAGEFVDQERLLEAWVKMAWGPAGVLHPATPLHYKYMPDDTAVTANGQTEIKVVLETEDYVGQVLTQPLDKVASQTAGRQVEQDLPVSPESGAQTDKNPLFLSTFRTFGEGDNARDANLRRRAGEWVMVGDDDNLVATIDVSPGPDFGQWVMVEAERPLEQPSEEETTHPREIINGDWITEAEGKFGTTMRLMVSERLRREGFLSLEFTTVQLMDEYFKDEGGYQKYWEKLAKRFPDWKNSYEEKAEEVATGLNLALNEAGGSQNLLEQGLLRIIYERGLNVGFNGGAEYSDFETYCFSVLGAKVSGDGGLVSVPLPNGEMIDPTKPITIAVIDSSEVEKARQLTPNGYDTDVYWKRIPSIYRTGLDNQGGLVFVWEIKSKEKQLARKLCDDKRCGDAASSVFEIIEEGLINLHSSDFPDFPVDGVWQTYPGVANQVRNSYFEMPVAEGPRGGRTFLRHPVTWLWSEFDVAN